MTDAPSRRLTPPMPQSRPEKIGWRDLWRLAGGNLFAVMQPRIYRAWMAEQRAVLYKSFIINQPSLVRQILVERPDDFPKSGIIRQALFPLLGNSVFVTNGETWKRQRRIIDPAFEGGRLRDVFGDMVAAGTVAVERLAPSAAPGHGPIDTEEVTAHLAADVIFRTLFSLPIEDTAARSVYTAFQAYQRRQPLLTPFALLRLPNLGFHKGKREAKQIRRLLRDLVTDRAATIAAGEAPDDLATKIMTFPDPVTGARFSSEEMVDQVAIFFLAGHETSASALAWTLYLLANDPNAQERAATEAVGAWGEDGPVFGDMRKLAFIRDVFREALRLYPPVPMMLRETAGKEVFRNRSVPKSSLCILSPWHLQRHERLWQDPHVFDPDRWSRAETKETARNCYMPFSTGPRVCTGAGFAMLEGVLLLAMLLRSYRFLPVEGSKPEPVTHLTVRSKDGIPLLIAAR